MPSLTTTALPIPKSGDEFEDICVDLLKRRWGDPYVNRHGRSGQKQHGVDIYGKPVHLKGCGSEIAAAQCKRVKVLTEAKIKKEIQRATEFDPKPEEYLILTTMKRDAKLQKYVRTQTWSINRVEIMFWEDLSNWLAESDKLLKKHFPQWFQPKTSKDDVIQMLVNANPDDFDYNDSTDQYLSKNDIRLRLIMNRSDEMEPFNECWVSKFADPNAYKQEVYLEYDDTQIKTFYFAHVDGCRYLIPYPKPKSATYLRISPLQYHLACILNFPMRVGYGIDEALRQAGITVDEKLADVD